MSEPDDLLGKADAFLKRYHPASASARHDVPVLTEVIAEASEPPTQTDGNTGIQNAPPATDLLQLEQRLRQSILDAVTPHLVKTVEAPLQERLDAHLQRALAALSAQIRTDLEALIREAVARAVATEMARMRGPSRGA